MNNINDIQSSAIFSTCCNSYYLLESWIQLLYLSIKISSVCCNMEIIKDISSVVMWRTLNFYVLV